MLLIYLMGLIDLIIGVLLLMSYSGNLFAVVIISIILLRGITTFIQILPPLTILLKIYSLVDLAIPFLILFSYRFSNPGVNLIFLYFLIKIGYSLLSYFLFR
ncbi:MAG: hypothetical protein DRP06_03400 [Candidatus Aenigmatarchaeota archaeon]|nr:MAG: hypothetical protein DRP06_03400 [Candidatus Aenigmarchaeota archaeon]